MFELLISLYLPMIPLPIGQSLLPVMTDQEQIIQLMVELEHHASPAHSCWMLKEEVPMSTAQVDQSGYSHCLSLTGSYLIRRKNLKCSMSFSTVSWSAGARVTFCNRGWRLSCIHWPLHSDHREMLDDLITWQMIDNWNSISKSNSTGNWGLSSSKQCCWSTGNSLR